MKKSNETGSHDFEREYNPEREKINEIIKRSNQFVVVCGPSGSGKTMAIKHLVDKYGFVEPPFLTTRELRPGEQEVGGVQVSLGDFMEQEMDEKMFLVARNYGNAYGYDLDKIFQSVVEDKNIVVEAPASNLTTDVAYFLPKSTIIAVLPLTTEEIKVQLDQRGLNGDRDKRIRLLNSEIEKEHIIRSCAVMNIEQVTPTHGMPEKTLLQIDELMDKKGFEVKN